MRLYQDASKEEITRHLKTSAEVQFYKNCSVLALLVLGVTIGLYLLTIAAAGGWDLPELKLQVILIAAICFAPLFLVYLYRIIGIFREREQYLFFRAKLSHAHRSKWVEAMYFTVLAEDADGNQFPVNTRAIFSTHSLAGMRLEDYINKTVTIAYNEETETVVIIS